MSEIVNSKNHFSLLSLACSDRNANAFFNFTDRKLSALQLEVLQKGLSFVPTNSSVEFLRNKAQELIAQSVSKYAQKNPQDPIAPAQVRRALDRSANTLKLASTRSNLTSAQRQALEGFVQAKSEIVIAPADKNLGVAILTMQHYRELAAKHLTNASLYTEDKRRESEVVDNIRLQLAAILTQLHKSKHMSKIAASVLSNTTNVSSRLPTFAIMPKVHKTPLAGRPIVRASNWLLTNLSRFLSPIFDSLRLQYEQKVGFQCVIESSVQLAVELSKIRFPKVGSPLSLTTLDFESLYTNLTTENVMTVIRAVGEVTGNDLHGIGRLTEFILTHNYFTFEGRVFQQRQGIAMGTNCAVTLANLIITHQTYVGLTQLSCIPRVAANSPVWFVRTFVDDVIIVSRTHADAVGVCAKLTNLGQVYPAPQTLAVTAMGESVKYLDLSLALQKSRNAQRITYSQYVNPVSKHMYVHYQSNHPPGVAKGLITNGYYRAILLNETEADMKQNAQLHIEKLMKSGYPLRLIRKIAKPKWQDKEALTQTLLRRIQDKHAKLHKLSLTELAETPAGDPSVFWYLNFWDCNAKFERPIAQVITSAIAGCGSKVPIVKFVQMRGKTIGELLRPR